MIEDDMYTESADGIALYPGDEIRVQSLTGATEGAEPYTWHDLAGQDVTKGFTLTQTDLGFTVDYESFETIIAAVKGADVVIAEGADLSGDMFDLVITMGETEYRFGFGIGLPVSGIELDPDHIIINADKQPVEEPEEPGEPETPPVEEPDEPEEPAVYGYARDYIRCTVRAVKALEEAAKDRDNPTIGVPETDPDALAALNECKNELTQADEFYTLVQGDSDGIQDDQLAADYYAAYNAATAMTLQIEMGTYTKSSVAEIIADLGDIMERYQ